jgi:hypothetical protein
MVIQQQSSSASSIVVATGQMSGNSPPTLIEASSGQPQQHIEQSSPESHVVRVSSSSNIPIKIDLVEHTSPSE